MSASPVLPQDWHPQSQGAELQRWHTGMTWPFWKVQHHTSTQETDTAEGRVTNWFLSQFSLPFLRTFLLRSLDGYTEQSKARERKRKARKMKDRKLEKSAPAVGLSQTDKWFICFGFTSAALLSSTSLSFHFSTSDNQKTFLSGEPYLRVENSGFLENRM